MCTTVIEALTPLNRTSCMKISLDPGSLVEWLKDLLMSSNLEIVNQKNELTTLKWFTHRFVDFS